MLAAVKAYIDMLGIWAALTTRSCQTLCWTHNLNTKSLPTLSQESGLPWRRQPWDRSRWRLGVTVGSRRASAAPSRRCHERTTLGTAAGRQVGGRRHHANIVRLEAPARNASNPWSRRLETSQAPAGAPQSNPTAFHHPFFHLCFAQCLFLGSLITVEALSILKHVILKPRAPRRRGRELPSSTEPATGRGCCPSAIRSQSRNSSRQ